MTACPSNGYGCDCEPARSDPGETWRARADPALGVLICRLDERIAGRQFGEDVILLHVGARVAAAEGATRIRSFMPFEATAADQAATRRLLTLISSANSIASSSITCESRALFARSCSIPSCPR